MNDDIFDSYDFPFEIPEVKFENSDLNDLDIPTDLKPAQKRFLRAYASAPGNIAAAARKARISRRTYYNWYDNDPDFKEALTNAAADVEDFVKSKLMEKIIQGDSRATIFFLKTYGGPEWGLTNPLPRKGRKNYPCSCNSVQSASASRHGWPGNAFTN